MPTFTTAQFDLQDEARTSNISRLSTPNVASGTVEFAVIPYTLAGTEAAADIIKLCLLPAGAIPIPELSKVFCESDPGTTLTIDIGTADDTDGWGRALVLSAGGLVECTSATLPAWVTTKTPIVADTGSGNAVVKATVASAASLTASTKLQFVLAYKRGR